MRGQAGRLSAASVLGAAALGSALALTATSAWLISEASLRPPMLTLMVAIVAVRAFGLAKGVLRYLERLATHDAALRLGADLRVRIWRALVRQGPALTARMRRGDLLARLTGDVDAQQDVLVRGLVPGAAALLAGAGVVGLFAVLLPAAAVVLAAGLLVAGVVAPLLAVAAGRRAARATSDTRGALAAGVVELLDGAADLLVLGAAQARRRRLVDLDDRLAGLERDQAGAAGMGWRPRRPRDGTRHRRDHGGRGRRARVRSPRAHGSRGPRPDAPRGGRAGRRAPGRRHPSSPRRCPRHGAWPPSSRGHRPSRIPPGRRPSPPTRASPPTGSRCAGPTPRPTPSPGCRSRSPPARGCCSPAPPGAGKSTVLAAVMRTLPPSRGTVTLGDVDTATADAEDVRARLGWCGPAAHLFDSTLRENLRLARPDASDDALLDGLRRARLTDWYAELPGGLDTALGEHGGAVSGGERQRLAMARVLLADRPVLTLDEPTAHLDAATAAAVAAEIEESTRGRTALVVTHRPAEFPGVPAVGIGRRTDAVRPGPG